MNVRVRHSPQGATFTSQDALPTLSSPSRILRPDRFAVKEANEFVLPIAGDHERHDFYAFAVEEAVRQLQQDNLTLLNLTLLDCSSNAGMPGFWAANLGIKSLVMPRWDHIAGVLRQIAEESVIPRNHTAEACFDEGFCCMTQFDILLPENKRANIVVMDPPGTPLHGLSPFALLPSIRKELLEANGLVVPGHACLEVALMESEELSQMFSIPGGHWHEVDLRVWNEEARKQGVLSQLVPYTKWLGSRSSLRFRWLSAPKCVQVVAQPDTDPGLLEPVPTSKGLAKLQLSVRHGPAKVTAMAAAAGLDVHLHPLVLINISDHVVRFRSARRSERVLGALLGAQEGRRVDVHNSFELVCLESGGQRTLDLEFFQQRLSQYLEVFPRYEFLGVGANENPFALLVDADKMSREKASQSEELPVKVYDATIHIEQGEATVTWNEVPYIIDTLEAERIAVNHVAKSATTAASGYSSDFTQHTSGLSNSVVMLSNRVKELLEHMKDVKEPLKDGRAPKNQEVLRQTLSICQALQSVHPSSLKQEFCGEFNDATLVVLLATLTKVESRLQECCMSLAQLLGSRFVLLFFACPAFASKLRSGSHSASKTVEELGVLWEHCATEGSECSCSGLLRFGEGDRWVAQGVAGSVTCDVQTFSGDPAFNRRKERFLSCGAACPITVIG
eukprot:g29684.t1